MARSAQDKRDPYSNSYTTEKRTTLIEWGEPPRRHTQARSQNRSSSKTPFILGGILIVVLALCLVSIVRDPQETISGTNTPTADNVPGASSAQTNPDETENQGEQTAAPADTDSEILTLLKDSARVFAWQVDNLEDRHFIVRDVVEAFAELQTDPLFDYVSGIQYTYYQNAADTNECTLVSFELSYFIEPAEYTSYRSDLERAVEDIIAGLELDDTSDELEAVVRVFRALQETCIGISASSSSAFTAYGCLVEHEATGKGFADAFYLIMRALGLECVVITDSAQTTSWNMVQVGGTWYHVNLYWDSRTDEDAAYSYLYLLCSDDAMRQGGAAAWDAPARVPLGYFEALLGTTEQERLEAAASLWEYLFDAGLESCSHLEMFRITYAEMLQAYDQCVSDAYYSYVKTHGVYYLIMAGLSRDECYVESIHALYRLTSDELSAYTDVVGAGIEQVLAQVDPDADTVEQIRSVHDWLVRNVAYDSSSADASHTPYGVFAYGQAVCEGYSYAFQLIMDALGIPCVTLSSTAMNHQWNMVCVDGTWLHIDITWDDPVPDRGADGQISYTYFLKTDKEFTELGYYAWTSEEITETDVETDYV